MNTSSTQSERLAAAGPWKTALMGLARDHAARLAGLGLFLIVLACLMAPLYASRIAHTDPFRANVAGSIMLDGREVDLMQPNDNPLHLGLSPIGPTWQARYLLGADSQGRDIAARLLYGGRNSLLIASASAVLCLALATVIGIAAGFLGA